MHLDHEDASLDPRAPHLDSCQRRKQDLLLVRIPANGGDSIQNGTSMPSDLVLFDDGFRVSDDVEVRIAQHSLGQPTDVSTPIDHALVHLEDNRRLVRSAGILEGDIAVERRTHERGLDTTTHAMLIGLPKRLWKIRAGNSAVNTRRSCQLREFHDARADGVERCRVLILLA